MITGMTRIIGPIEVGIIHTNPTGSRHKHGCDKYPSVTRYAARKAERDEPMVERENTHAQQR